jgi:2-desacetyl-2-hydroxyethyl bacteriochlorophyllide A dehydrogenase
VRALVYLGPRRMELQEAPDPEPGKGEVVVRTVASAICGSDLHGFREASPRRIPPLVMGHETVGTIDGLGPGVQEARFGERVVLKPILACGRCARCVEGKVNLCSNGRLVGRDLAGGFAERLVVPVDAVTPLPGGIADDAATLIEPTANAVHVTSRSVRRGDFVVVIGAGPIGMLVARLAGLAGAGTVVSIDPVDTRRMLAERQGATAVGPHDAERTVSEATGGDGADVVIDAVGLGATWASALRLARAGGRVEAVGLGAASGEIDFFSIVGRELSVTGSFGWTDGDFARAIDLVSHGAIQTEGWFSTFALEDGQRAFEELVDGIDHFKVVLTPS